MRSGVETRANDHSISHSWRYLLVIRSPFLHDVKPRRMEPRHHFLPRSASHHKLIGVHALPFRTLEVMVFVYQHLVVGEAQCGCASECQSAPVGSDRLDENRVPLDALNGLRPLTHIEQKDSVWMEYAREFVKDVSPFAWVEQIIYALLRYSS